MNIVEYIVGTRMNFFPLSSNKLGLKEKKILFLCVCVCVIDDNELISLKMFKPFLTNCLSNHLWNARVCTAYGQLHCHATIIEC
jgi:hypothetical protein